METIEDSKRLAFEELEEVYRSYLERLDKKAKSITGADIDKADIILLETDLYTLNQEEFDVLQDKYEGNRSMERMLAGYANKRGKADRGNATDTLKGMLVCRFMSDEEKEGLQANYTRNAKAGLETIMDLELLTTCLAWQGICSEQQIS